MSSLFVNVVIGLGTAFIGYLLGRLWQTLMVRRRYWRARQFWQPVVNGHFQIVIGRFAANSYGFYEPTGVVGGGDAIASRLLGDLFNDIGLERPDSVYVDETEVDRNKNLILLGGPDTNRIVDEALTRVSPGLRVTEPGGPEMHVVDLDSNDGSEIGEDGTNQRTYVAKLGTAEMTDYGVIIRTRSPFKAGRALVMISGAFGYGTWAGVELSQSADFLRRCEKIDTEGRRAPKGLVHIWSLGTRLGFRKSAMQQWAQIECLYKVDVIDGRPQSWEILVLRRIADRQRGPKVVRPSDRAGSSSSD